MRIPTGRNIGYALAAGALAGLVIALGVGVALVSADRLAVIKKHDELVDLSQIAREYFPETDFVLVEGGRGDRGLKKVVVLNDETVEAAQIPPDELMAVVSNKKLQADKPVFSPDQIHEIADFLEKISI